MSVSFIKDKIKVVSLPTYMKSEEIFIRIWLNNSKKIHQLLGIIRKMFKDKHISLKNVDSKFVSIACYRTGALW